MTIWKLELNAAKHHQGHRLFRIACIVALAGILTPRAFADECQPTTVEAFQSEFAVAESSIRAQPEKALEHIAKAEAMLPCLSSTLPQDALSGLYQAKGIALLYASKDGKAKEALNQYVLVNPDVDCAQALARFGSRGNVRQAVTICEEAVEWTQDSVLKVKLEGLKGIVDLYVDGVLRERTEDHVPVDLAPGRHLLQYTQEDGAFSSKWLVVPAPEDPDKSAMWLNLKKMGLAPLIEEVVETGSLRIDGLEPDAVVAVDGRDRRDLPVIRNLEVGERHLLIRFPDGSVVGATVTIVADKEAVYNLAGSDDKVRREGVSGRKIAAFGAIGAGVLSAAGSGLMLSLAAGTYSDAENLYQSYKQAESGANFDILYEGAESKREEAQKTQLTGVALGGVAVLAAGAGVVLMATGGGEPVGWLEPYVAPLAGAGHLPGGIAMGVKGRF